MAPISAGYFTMAELRKVDDDGVPLITLDMVCDANEWLFAEAERERLAYEDSKRR